MGFFMVEYFSHDYNARTDEKIVRLLSKEGWYGYGLYWALIEKLYEADGFLDKDYDSIAFDMRTECERIANVVEGYKLFKIKDGRIYSDSVLARLKLRKGKSEKAKQSASFRWNKPKEENANGMRTHCDGNAIKEKKSKVNKNKINILSSALDAPYNFSEKTKTMYTDPDRRMAIIAYYWFVKGFTFETPETYAAAIKRELRPSKELVGYPNEQIKRTCQWLQKNADFKWTLETVHKYIDEPLENLKAGGKPKTEEDLIKELKQKYESH